MALVIDDPDRARLADLLGQMALIVQAPAPTPAPGERLHVSADRLRALTGMSPSEFRAAMQCTDEEFSDYMRRRDPSPELPLFSAITPSKAAARTSQFSSLVKELTAAE